MIVHTGLSVWTELVPELLASVNGLLPVPLVLLDLVEALLKLGQRCLVRHLLGLHSGLLPGLDSVQCLDQLSHLGLSLGISLLVEVDGLGGGGDGGEEEDR